MTQPEWPRFDEPPLVESVAALEFAPIPYFGLSVLSRLHDLWLPQFPVISEHPTLQPTRPALQGPGFSFEFGLVPSQTRVWMASPDQQSLIQIQHDRLILNWRRLDASGTSYPGFESLRNEFIELTGQFIQVVGEVSPLVTEWSYVNAIDPTVVVGSSAFAVWNEPVLAEETTPVLTRFQHVRAFDVVGGSGQLDVVVEPLGPAETGPVNLSISARCFHNPDTTLTEALSRLDAAHRMARHAFDGVTTPEIRKHWGEQR
ncbi:TIGR04255 family protein [Nocardioides sp.]|uniref:TIGR04255 family protein n=1 Tax=Nocardioides sp. TaxID=35761 RepID=UPI00260236F9|nr:TIGR04255 family protein [Nocardioides sp.]